MLDQLSFISKCMSAQEQADTSQSRYSDPRLFYDCPHSRRLEKNLPRHKRVKPLVHSRPPRCYSQRPVLGCDQRSGDVCEAEGRTTPNVRSRYEAPIHPDENNGPSFLEFGR